MTIKHGNKYRLKRDGTIWEILDIEYPMDSHDPNLGTVILTAISENSVIHTGENIFWEYFDETKN